jgi:DNA-binding NtrC family response regulator
MADRGKRSFDDLSTVVRAEARRGVPSASEFTLAIVEGPDKGASIILGAGERSHVLLGQSPACELRVTDREVSRRHASFTVDRRSLRVTDLGSTNGTMVNGVRIAEALLTGGETVRVGSSAVAVRANERAAGGPRTAATSFGATLGASLAMRDLYPICERLAASNVPLVIEGETGTGKEVLAESIHDRSPRAGGPFVVFDCTAVPPSLVESTLFGHERGAFTGALATHQGVFEEAHGGTLLIDEIGDLDLALQAKLLRALERSEVRRLGGSKWIRVDTRVIAATRRDLDRQVQEGTFRDDLFFRLAVARIELPPLRRREGDVEVLARHFWSAISQSRDPLPPDFLPRYAGYPWPGNVRELHNAIARRVALGDVTADALSAHPMPPSAGPAASPPGDSTLGDIDRVLALDLPITRARQVLNAEFDRRYVARVLERFGGNVARAAAASGIARRYFRLLRARHAK